MNINQTTRTRTRTAKCIWHESHTDKERRSQDGEASKVTAGKASISLGDGKGWEGMRRDEQGWRRNGRRSEGKGRDRLDKSNAG